MASTQTNARTGSTSSPKRAGNEKPSSTSSTTLPPTGLNTDSRTSKGTDNTINEKPVATTSAVRTALPSNTATTSTVRPRKRKRYWRRFVSWLHYDNWVPCTSESSAHPNEKERTTTSREARGSHNTKTNGTAGKIPARAPEENGTVVIVPPTPVLVQRAAVDQMGVTSGAVQAPGSTGEAPAVPIAETLLPSSKPLGHESGSESEDASYSDEDEVEDQLRLEDALEEERRLIARGGMGIPIGPDGKPQPLLPPLLPEHSTRPCLVLDLDETLVHSSFKSIQQADFIVPVEIENTLHSVYVIKRPGVDEFLRQMGKVFEVVVFTASLSKYADPVLDKLDIHQVVTHRLFRESCYNHKGNYVKDLSQLGRAIGSTIILDNSPASYIFHPSNAVPVSSWFNDPHDTELTDLVPFLEDLIDVGDVRVVLDGNQ